MGCGKCEIRVSLTKPSPKNHTSHFAPHTSQKQIPIYLILRKGGINHKNQKDWIYAWRSCANVFTDSS